MNVRHTALTALTAVLALSACASDGDLVVTESVGVTARLEGCPGVGVPDYTGDITTFTGADRSAAALDVTAAITNVRSTCDDTGEQIVSTATFDVYARRADTRGSRTVELPYFATVLRAGRVVVSKQVGTVQLVFADGAARASASASASSYIDRAAATLPADIREQITRRRRAGEEEAAIDPLTKPEVRAALAQVDFELLVGFQLTRDQLAYNATR